jgi:hypothetical protein
VNRIMKQGGAKRKTKSASDGELTSRLKQRNSHMPESKGPKRKERNEDVRSTGRL